MRGVVHLIGLVLASWLITQSWKWDQLYGNGNFQDPSFYRIYWQLGTPDHWCPSQYQEFNAALICDGVTCQADVPEPAAGPGEVVFFNITALNDAGESEWDHGAKDGICP